MTTRRGTIVTTAVLAVLLAGCAGSSTPTSGDTSSPPEPSPAASEGAGDGAPTPAAAVATVQPGAPDGVTGEDVTVVAGDDARQVQVVTFGSSTCPVVPTDVAWDAGASVLRLTLSGPDAYDRPCTMDLVPTTSVVTLPDDAPDATGLTVDVDGRSTVVE